MSRWSEEEDKYILELLQESTDELNYKELVEKHNFKFNKQRTEDTYKVRIRKVIKDNNIEIKTNNHWSEAEKEYLIKAVQSNPINIDWKGLSIKLNRAEYIIRRMYNELITPEQHIASCISSISKDDIKELMVKIETKCSNCNKVLYCQPLLWNNNKYCEDCHYTLYNDIINERWKLINEYSCKTGKNKCKICEKIYDFTQKSLCKFNYDHINMFEKNGSIYGMNKQGIDINIIYKEIDLCQLLCISCHSIITQIEQKSGFNRVKINMVKEYNKTEDEEKKQQLLKQYSDIYYNYMTHNYNIVKRLLS